MNTQAILNEVEKKIFRLKQSLTGIIRRGEIASCLANYFCQITGYENEKFNDVELWQQYGIASRPSKGAEMLMVLLGGLGDNAIAIASQLRGDRPTDLVDGEVVTHGKKSSAGQAQVRHKPDGSMDLISANGQTVNINGTTDYQLRGTSFKTAFDAFLISWSSAVAGLASSTDPAVTAYGTDLALALGTLQASATNWLSTKGRLG